MTDMRIYIGFQISGDDFMIDDPLIQKARTEGILADQDIPLKPWDKKYQSARAKRVGAVAIPKGQYFGEEPLQKSRTATSLVVREELSRPVTASEEFSDGMKSPGLTLSSARMKRRNISNLYAYLINANRPQSSSKVDSIDSIPQFPVVDDGDSLDSGCIGTVPIVDFEDDGLPAQSMGTNHEERVPSAIYSRRLTSAQRIVRDAKFELCTVRPCTSSALLLSRRAKAAPLFGTEEQSSLERFLSSKHLDRPKSPPKVTDLTGDGKEAKVRDKFVRPPVTPMGAYRPVTINEVYSDNEKLYKRLQSTNFYEAKRKAEATLDSLNDALAGGAAGAVGMRGTMVPMVHARARSIEERVVPPKKMLSRTDQLNLDAAEAKALIQAEQDETKATEEDLVVAKKKGKHAAKYMSPPKKPAVIYGANRLKSAEMTTMPIQTPWSSVSATYTVNMAV